MTSFIVTITSVGTIFFQVVFVCILFAIIFNIQSIIKNVKKYSSLYVFLLALGAMIGSLVYSIGLSYPPCDLCWYGRIALYPLVVLFGYDLVRKTNTMTVVGIIFSSIGVLIAIYHNALFWFNSSTAPCSSGISCLTQYVYKFGYITIPLMSLTIAALITLILAVRLKSERNSFN